MQEGVKTWVDTSSGGVAHFNKPVLKHHNTYDDPIGRVVSASYTALKSGTEFYDDWMDPARGSEEGSGRTDLVMAITNADAIEKFLKGEYLTFSTSFHSPQAICTVCGVNVMKDGWCEHSPGDFYEISDEEKVECYFVTGQMFYKEVSVVNDPAQPMAVVKNMSMADCISNGRDYQSIATAGVAPVFSLQDNATGTMTRLTKKIGESDAIPSGGKTIRRRLQIQIPGPKQLTPADMEQFEQLQASTAAESGSEDAESLLDNPDFALAHIARGCLNQGLLYTDEEISEDDRGGLSLDDLLQLIDRYSDAIDAEAFWDEKTADASLSAKERKKLKSTVYCGPNRSFPVPDCAHVTAARSLIGRYKGSAETKQRILDNVSNMASKFDCGGGDAGLLSTETQEMTTKNGDNSGAGGAPASTNDESRFQVLTDQIGALSTEKKELQSDRDRLQQELADMTAKATDSAAECHRLRALNLSLMRSISGHEAAKDCDTFEKIERYGESLAERSADSISDAIQDEGQAFADALKAHVEPAKGVDETITDSTTPEPRAAVRNQEALEDSAEPKPEEKPVDPADMM